jgi:hypothetical protein
MKKLYFIILTSLLVLNAPLNGQFGNKQAGIRSGYRSGIFLQMTTESGNSEVGYNAMIGFNNKGIQFTGMRIIYETSLNEISPDLWFSWGYGGHFGFMVTDHLNFLGERYSFQHNRFCPVLGADGWIGAEYRFREIPMIISLNAKPFVEVTIPVLVNLMPGDIGISVAYVF